MHKHVQDIFNVPLFTHPAKQVPSAALQLVNRQAEDEGLWFEAVTAPEAHLQAALRKLHAAVESSQKQVPMTEGEIDDLMWGKRPWVGLTQEEANYIWENNETDWESIKRVEAKLKEKNT